MVRKEGGLKTTYVLLRDSEMPMNRFGPLRKRGMLHMTVEDYVVLPNYHPLFDDTDREIDQFRLETAE
jgi:hypothetical protein